MFNRGLSSSRGWTNRWEDTHTMASLGAQMVKNPPVMWETEFSPWIGKILWRREWQPTPVFLPGEYPWTEEPGRLWSMGSQSRMRLSNYQSHTQESMVWASRESPWTLTTSKKKREGQQYLTWRVALLIIGYRWILYKQCVQLDSKCVCVCVCAVI